MLACTRIGWFLGHEEWQPESLVDHGRQAEDLGFEALLVSDHLQPWTDDVGAAGFSWATMGALAARTTTATIMPAVVCPLFRYHPVLVAQAAATVSRLARGRFELGLGTGQAINELPLMPVLPRYRERRARMTEALTIVRGLLNGERVSSPGPYYPVSSMYLYSRNTTAVPVYLAAAGRRSAALAGELADGVITSVKDPTYTRREVVDVARAAARAAGRPPPRVVLTLFAVLARDETDAYRALLPWRGMRTSRRMVDGDPRRLREHADALGRDGVLAKYPYVQHPEQLLDLCRAVIEENRPDILALQVASVDPVVALRRFAPLIDQLRR